MTDRFQIVAESVSGHCCFDYTIVDTQRPLTLPNGQPWTYNGQQRYHQVCECFEEQDAKFIAATLNGALLGGDVKRHVICLCPDCIKPTP